MPPKQAYSSDLDDDAIARILASAPFAQLDDALFPAHEPLRHIIARHARLRRYVSGALIVRKGDYGSAAFVVLRGRVQVIINPPLPEALLGRRSVQRLSRLQALSQLWHREREPEQRSDAQGDTGLGRLTQEEDQQAVQVVLPDLAGLLAERHTVPLGEGEMIGEIAALSRSPRGASVVADGDCELVEIRWQGLRRIRRYAPPFRERVDTLFRTRGLRQQLRQLPLFAALPSMAFDAVIEASEIDSFGAEVWYEDRTLEQDEPVVCAPGQPADALWVVQGGFARIIGDGPVNECTEGFLRPGEMFGLEEAVAGWRAGQVLPRRQGLRALGTLDLLRIPLTVLQQQVFSQVDATLLPASPDAEKEVGDDKGLVDFLVDHRYLNGRAGMLIDLDRCTRCDDCVRACAKVHKGNPRFVRDGRSHGSTLVAQACMHCVDPVCLVGCPTGAIHRSPLDGCVTISESACIGCSSCADSCPYGNIRMVELRAADGQPLLDEASGSVVRKASSCDLCSEQRSGPACQTACPYDALIRVDIGDQAAIKRWMRR